MQNPLTPILRPAAQYLRMSTDHQNYSFANQSAVIASYATEHHFEVVASFEDAGKSGVTIKGRYGLKSLLADVLSGKAIYRDVLVRDVSRWGRFQDPDQAAHYEFLCREAGIAVHYCAESFANDGSPMAGVLKHLKRVMAGEYSRELSARLKVANRHKAALGYALGGPAPFGSRRQAFGPDGRPKAVLGFGMRKPQPVDHVMRVRASEKDVSTVQQIFSLYLRERLRYSEIARRLNSERKLGPSGRKWTGQRVARVLQNEIAIGHMTFNMTDGQVGERRYELPASAWRRVQVMDPLVDPKVFAQARKRMEQNRRFIRTDQQLLDDLTKLYAAHGYLSAALIISSPRTAHFNTYRKRFGSISEVYRLVGYAADSERHRSYRTKTLADEEVLSALRSALAAHGFLSATIIRADPDLPSVDCVERRFGSLKAAYLLAGYTDNVAVAAWERRRVRRARGPDVDVPGTDFG